MNIIVPEAITNQIELIYEHGISSGLSLGWKDFDELMTLKLGTTFYVYGQPASGKSEWWLEVLVNTSELYGWRHAIFSPESGQAEHLIGELISKKFRKPFYQNIPGCITKAQVYEGITWVNKHFRIFDQSEGEDTVEEFIKHTEQIELDGFRPHTTLIDPWNELHHDLSKHGGRQDLYLEEKLGFFRKDAIIKRRINCLITHISDQQIIQKDGQRFYPSPTAREIAGGQAWYRKGMNMIGMWRPPTGMIGEDGTPYEENEAHVIIHKYKPKGTGKRGTQVFFYDFKTNSYLIKTKPYGSKLESIRTRDTGHKSSGNETLIRPNDTNSVEIEREPF